MNKNTHSFLLLILALPSLAFAEVQTTLNMTVPSLVMGTSGTFSASQASGPAGTNTGTVLHSYAGEMNFIQTSGTGRFASYNGVSRFGIGFDVFQVFQSFISANYLTVVSSGTACPSSTTYDWIMVRQRTADAPRGASVANSPDLTAGGVMNYNSSTSAFTGVSDFNLAGPTLNSSPTYGIEGFNSTTCASGQNLGQSTGVSSLDDYMYIFYGANSMVIVTADGNPEVIVGVPQQTLSSSTMTSLANYVFTGIGTVFNNATTQQQSNVYLYPNASGTTFAIDQETSLTNPLSFTNVGTLTCTNLNSPTTGFCSGTLSVNGTAGTGNMVCLISPNSTENLMMCAGTYPGSPTTPVTLIAKTVNQAVMQVSVSPVDASVTHSGNSTTVTATVENLSSRYIPTIGNPSNPSLDLSAPWSDTGAFGGGSGTCGTTLKAYATCTFPVTFTSAAIGTVTSTLRVAYDNGTGTPPNATSNLVGVTGLVSLAMTPSLTYVADGGNQQMTATATYSDGSTQNVSNAVGWTTSNTAVGSLSSTGFGSWLSDGSTTFTATLASDSASDTINVVTQPVLTSISNYYFPSTYLNQLVNFYFDFNNISGGSPGNDTNMTYTCLYNQTYNGVFDSGNTCTSLPGTMTFGATTGQFSWTPSLGAWGPYQFQITGTLDGSVSTTETFYIDVNPLYSTTDLIANWDAQFANFMTPYSAANSTWDDITGNGNSGTSNSTTHATWTGSGIYSSPYALTLDGSGNMNFGTSMLSSYNQFMFYAWVNPSSPSTTDTVIFGNSSDATGRGFTVRQSASSAGKLDFVAGIPSFGASYVSTVMADSPIGYWRFGETSGTTAADSSGTGNTGTYQNSPSLGQTGALTGDSNTAVLLDGATQYVTTTDSYNNPQTYSMEVWFKTAANYASGGVIVGFGNAQTGTSSNYDRHIWMDNTGTIYFGIYNGATYTVNSNSGYNDGNWHQVVATFGSNVMTLYLDGASVGSYSGQPSQNYAGYWRFGYDSLGGWSPSPTSSYFAGTLDEGAVYSTVLSAARVQAHYVAATHQLCTSQTTFASNTWNQVSGITNGTTTTFYVNGREECQSFDFGSSTPATAFYMGSTASNTKNWTGSIADMKMYVASSGTVGTASTVEQNFSATADRYRQNPVGGIVTNGLVLNLDAANAYRSLAAFPNGCASTSLSWLDLSTTLQTALLTDFSSCGAAAGWNGNGTTSSPFRLTFNSSQSDYVALSNPVSGTNVFTYEAWFRTTSDGGIVATNNAPVNGGESTWDPMFYVDTSGYLRGGDYTPMYQSTVTVNDGAWRDVVIVGTGTQVSLYINGALNTTTASGTCENLAAYLELGVAYTSSWTNGNGGWFYFTGDIAKVAAYNRDLSAAEILQNCNAISSRFGVTCL